MGCLISILDFKREKYIEEDDYKIKTEPIINNINVDCGFYYSSDLEYSPPPYNRLYGWD